jgi:uncharacterized membrane protein YqjE
MLRRVVRSAASLLLARAEFAVVELTASGAAALHWLLSALAAAALLTLTLIAVTASIVLALWDRVGWYSIGVLALVYAAVTAFAIHRLLRRLRNWPPVLAQTLSELSKDREALFGHEPVEGTEVRR